MGTRLPEQPVTPLQRIDDNVTRRAGITLWLKRDDLIHPDISGNKWRKLKYNIGEAVRQRAGTLLTFGGAFSNHLYAVAAAAKQCGFRAVGIVRGHELTESASPTLTFCHRAGMQLEFVTREAYRLKDQAPGIRKIIEETGAFVIPEGGSNPLALPGVAEMVYEIRAQSDSPPGYFAVAAGTGGTAAGILSTGSRLLAFPVLKNGQFLEEEISSLTGYSFPSSHLRLETGYHFGGYAKHTPQLLQFLRDFEDRHGVPLEQVYTAKMLMGLYDLISRNAFRPGESIVAVHTGGLQGRLSL